LNLVPLADKYEIPALLILLDLTIKTDTFPNEAISESGNRIAIPLDGYFPLSVQEGAKLDDHVVTGIACTE